MINEIQSVCHDCTFEWSNASTPVVDGINADSISAIQITGRGFDSIEPINNLVLIGNVPCNVISSTNTSITCSAGTNINAYFYFIKNLVVF